ncbi:MAG: MobF family relaxase, partial [Dermatophilaceae bacterium]
LVVTRQNNRLLSCGRGWVKNGDHWLVQEVAADGAVTVARTMGAGIPGGRRVVLPADYVRQHVELGYATTAHRAQGRTVDTAHAFVSVTTQREVLYVAATRGRESNRLYVDTMYDPDVDTQHGLPAERDAGDVLRQVLQARGADLSATETIAADWSEQHGIVRMWAEYDTIAGVAQRDRYDALVTSSCSGVPAEQVEGLRESAAYGPLLASLREAEAFGLDVAQGLPRLVNGRTLSSADDVAAVLHGRVDRWIRASGPQRRAAADRIVGLFPRLAGVTDPDMARALDDRQTLLQQRAREVATTAVENRQPWTAQMGLPPSEPVRRELWLRRLDTVAAYRERWGITDRSILGTGEPASLEQEAQRRLAQSAADGALAIARDERADVGVGVGARGHAMESQMSREGVEL